MNSQTNIICRHSLPMPLSQLYIKYRAQSTHLTRIRTLTALIEGAIRFIASISTANLICNGTSETKKTTKLLERLFINPSFGTVYFTLKEQIDLLYKTEQYIFCPEYYQLCHNDEFEQAIGHIIDLRNKASHENASMTEESALEEYTQSKALFELVLNEIGFLSKYRLGHFQDKLGRFNESANL